MIIGEGCAILGPRMTGGGSKRVCVDLTQTKHGSVERTGKQKICEVTTQGAMLLIWKAFEIKERQSGLFCCHVLEEL